MVWIKSLVIAFSMYSRLPMPKVDWEERPMRYALCFFPLIGAVEGALFGGVFWLLCKLDVTKFLSTAVLLAVPVFITGGIHMDGFCDTVDALASHQSQEKKLQIMKDSNAGAFAVIACTLLFILKWALLYELRIDTHIIIFLSAGFIGSRALSGFSVVTFPCAKNSGLAATFSSAAQKNSVRLSMALYLLIAVLLMAKVDIKWMLVCMGCILTVFALYYRTACRQFGGITGDLSGFFLEICEFTYLMGCVLCQKIF